MRKIEGFRSSSSFQVATVFLISLSLLLGLVIYFILTFSADRSAVREAGYAIDEEVQTLQEALRLGGEEGLKTAVVLRLNRPGLVGLYELYGPSGDKLLGGFAPGAGGGPWESAPPSGMEASPEPGLSGDSGFGSVEILARPTRLPSGHLLIVGREIPGPGARAWAVLAVAWLAAGVGVVLGICFYIIGFFVVKRIRNISETVFEIMDTGNISKRIPIHSQWDDLSRLISVLNRMLDEIEKLVTGTKRVTDDIAHDMRAPLTRLRNRLEGLEDEESRRELLNEADSLLSMFSGLLRLAEIETASRKSGFSQSRLDRIADDAADLYRPLAAEKSIGLSIRSRPCEALCDRDLLFQCFANVIDNAVKFTPAGGSISVSMEPSANGILFRVRDSGPGISGEFREHVFRRFFRLSGSRSNPGHGLGLSLVKAVVDLHGGWISLGDSDSGLDFMIGLGGVEPS